MDNFLSMVLYLPRKLPALLEDTHTAPWRGPPGEELKLPTNSVPTGRPFEWPPNTLILQFQTDSLQTTVAQLQPHINDSQPGSSSQVALNSSYPETMRGEKWLLQFLRKKVRKSGELLWHPNFILLLFKDDCWPPLLAILFTSLPITEIAMQVTNLPFKVSSTANESERNTVWKEVNYFP